MPQVCVTFAKQILSARLTSLIKTSNVSINLIKEIIVESVMTKKIAKREVPVKIIANHIILLRKTYLHLNVSSVQMTINAKILSRSAIRLQMNALKIAKV